MTNKLFIDKGMQWLTLVYVVAFGLLMISTNHGDFVLWLSDRHFAFGDIFFKYWTNLGDGVLLAAVALFFLFTNIYRFYYMLLAIVLQTVFVHIFKQWLFDNEPRPKTFFADQLDNLNFVEGVNVRGFDSFPSGHTSSAFVLAFVLISIVRNRVLNVLIFVAAVLVGISRVYILQHFLRDIYFGSVFGILAALIAWYIMRPYSESSKLNRGVLKRK
ncbi:MAG: membrane-associated phospholipid phosphatase [Roseivirga sp.]|jgi:membrane-associated phospholipid phosphatase